MIIDTRGRATTQLKSEAEQYKVRSDKNIHVMKVPEAYKQKLMTEGLWEKLYVRDKKNRIYWLPPSAGKAVWPKHSIRFDIKSEELYDYQKQIIGQLRRDQPRSCMIVSGTGTGKSMIIAGIIGLTKARTLIVVPSIAIANGLLEKLSKRSDSVYFAQGDLVTKTTADVVICHHQTFNKYYDQINGKFEVLIQDEQHHLSEKRKEQYCKWMGGIIYGTTATPMRKEFGVEGFKMFYGKIYDTGVEALPVKVYRYVYEYDYNSEETEAASEGLAPDSNEIFRRLVTNNTDRYNKLIEVIQRLELMGYKKFIVFSDRVEHIKRTISVLLEKGYNAVGYYGATKKDEAEAIIKGLDKFVIVGHPASCGEGFDIPSIEVSILFTSTGRQGIVEQIAGRARRYSGDKKSGILVDFVDKLSIMGGKQKSLSASQRNKIYKENGWEVTNFK